MGMDLILYIEKVFDKLQSILHTLAGWVVAILLFLADFIVGHELARLTRLVVRIKPRTPPRLIITTRSCMSISRYKNNCYLCGS